MERQAQIGVRLTGVKLKAQSGYLNLIDVKKLFLLLLVRIIFARTWIGSCTDPIQVSKGQDHQQHVGNVVTLLDCAVEVSDVKRPGSVVKRDANYKNVAFV